MIASLRAMLNAVLSFILRVRHPGTSKTLPRPLPVPLSSPCTHLLPVSALKSKAFGWPEKAFTPENSVKGVYGTEPWLSIVAGEKAIDFKLENLNGGDYQLSELLQTAPVVISFGMYTCPAYQLSREAEAELVRQYSGQVHFIHVYTIEPHPKGSCSPDNGKPWELVYSKYPQAFSYQDRKKACTAILDNHPSDQLVLIDSFNESGLINPVWSTYGPAPRAAFLIRPDGIIDTSQLWFDAKHLSVAIIQLLGELKRV